MSIEAETNVNSTVVEVEVTTAPVATVEVGGSTAAPVSSAPAGDAVVEGPQSVTVVSGPPGPPGPIGSGELEMRVDGAFALIRQETELRAAADEALASRATVFETELGEFSSSLSELETSYSTLGGAFALLKSEVEAARSGELSLLARITLINEARIDGDIALATSISEQAIIVGNHSTAIGTLTQSYADLNTAFGLVQTEIEAARGGAGSLLARLTTLDQARVDGDTALATRASSLEAEVGAARNGQANLAARISQVDTARADGDTALATRATNLEAELTNARSGQANLAARLGQIDTARVDGDSALASRATSLEAEMQNARGEQETLAARLTTIDSARVSGDEALATRATSLEAEMANARGGQATLTARLGQIDTARADGDSALASRATALEAEISGAKAGQTTLLARLTQLDQARIDGDTALSSTLTAVEAKANNATAFGAMRLVAAALPSGVSALYEWELIAGAKKVGMRAGVMSAGGQPGFVEFDAEAFRIRNSASSTIPIFEVKGGQVYINGSQLPVLDDLPPPYADFPRMPYHIAFDDRGRLTDAEPAFRLRSFDLAVGGGVGSIPYITNTAAAPGGGVEIEEWQFTHSSALGRSLLGAANQGAARSAIAAQAANDRLSAIAAIPYIGSGAVPYVEASTPPGSPVTEAWATFATSSLGRSLINAADQAAARALIGAATAGGGPHTHVIADVTGLQAALDGKAASSHSHSEASTSAAGFMSAADKTKLNGIAAGATANATDAALRARSSHTGTQAISTVTGLQAALDGKQAANDRLTAIAAIPYLGSGGVPYVETSTPPGGGTPAEAWATIATGATGRSLMGAANAASALSTLGAAASSHTHTIAQVSGLQAALDGKAAADMPPLHSGRDFPQGTLIRTDIGTTGTTPFLVEIRGNSYGAQVPFDVALQGYIYQGSIINHGGYSNGAPVPGLVMFAHSGQLCVWFPYQSYWQGFEVRAIVALAGRQPNRVLSITNAAKPASGITMEIAPNIRQGQAASDRLTAIAGISYIGSGGVPYVEASTPPGGTPAESWATIATGATGRSLMGAASAATARTTIGAAATSHTHAIADVTSLQATLNAKANLASPALTGAPTAPTAATATNNTQVATTAFVQANCALQLSLTGGTLSGDLVVNGTNGIDVRAGISGGYGTSNGGASNWGANIWGMGNAYDGTGLGTSYSLAGHYGISWLRGAHTGANAVAGEGLYVTQAGATRAAIGSSGIWSAGNIDAYGNLSAANFSSVGISSGFQVGATGMYSSRNTAAAAYHLSIYNPNGNVGGIVTSGTVTTYATSSDHRRKHDVEPLVEFELTHEQFDDLPNALLRVMLLQPSSYRRVEEPDGPLHHGFIAHELQAVMPHAVVGQKDAVDEDGGQVLQLVDHSKLVTDTVAGLQGLTIMVLDHFAVLTAANDDRFEAIESRLDVLEAA